MAAKILLLEDDLSLNEIINEALSDEGFKVSCVYDAQEALEKAYEEIFDLWIFDVKVPKGNGFEALKELRESGKNTPAIFLTSLSMLDDVKQGFLSGCDDYIKKPFDIDELIIRVKNIIKRNFSHQKEDLILLNSSKNISFDPLNKTLYQDKTIINLTNKEKELLVLLLKKRPHFVSIETIFDEIWSLDEEPVIMSLRVYVKNLRKILGKDLIINQRNIGYAIRLENEK
ncbi:response regulator transcription factor [Campylobacter lari]|uniref:Two-component system response regulator n=1 Tax=Campylobacter lari (strain RM2100 / D67 / ATCC BAA-1060) TaxID=306263 RepID=B9KEK9_CAMLR|nr:response regulator transcription factor [Campylobacter lari]ACM63494.1 two-component system response regulator [Campylobacter lari RM2100]EAH6292125.1 DNA-binding response regulator [Campylobacter lari]EAI6154994.1 response regulator transcription factor [Campylobacter lari]EAI7870239.1 response regulator transcription factor [Campylobacter lari]EAI8653302.1 response regulator transcription factor [Campylobacter lari]